MQLLDLLRRIARFDISPIVFAVLLIVGCGGGGGTSIPRVPLISAELTSFPPGSIPTGFNSSITVAVLDGPYGLPIPDAVVSINGVTLTYQIINNQFNVGASGVYKGNVVVAPGGAIALSVKVDGKTYAALTTQNSSYPNISTPVSGAAWSSDSINNLSWSGSTSSTNSVYRLGIMDGSNPNGNWIFSQEVPIGTNSYSIPAYNVTGGNRLVVAGILTTFADIPNAIVGSGLLIGGYNFVPITVTGMPVTTRMSGYGYTPSLRGVTCSGTQFVVVGTGGTILTSPDGISWVTRAESPPNYSGVDLNDVTWSGTQFVAVAGDLTGSISTSLDGIKWTLRNSGPTVPLYGVVWSGKQFVAVGSGGTILTSPDGISWTPQTSGVYSYTLPSGSRLVMLNKVAWSGNQYVVVGSYGTILTSPDGITWTQRSSGTTNDLNGVTWSGSQFVAVGGNTTTYTSTILTSSDGVSWTLQTSPPLIFLNDYLYGVTWSGTQFVAVGMFGIIFTSPDGVSWTQQASGTSNELTGIAGSGTRLVAVGRYGTILSSP